MISTKRNTNTNTNTVPFRRSMLHGNPFPEVVPDDWEHKRLVRWDPPHIRDALIPELSWIALWGTMLWNMTMSERLLTVRSDWSRK